MGSLDEIGIILIDDSFIDRTIVRKNMELFYPGIPFTSFSSGKEALAGIESGEVLAGSSHCLILLDIYMPEMNGFAFADLFSDLPEEIRKRYTIVMLSSSIDGGDMENVKNRKVIARFISKPLNESVLKSVLDDTLQLLSSRRD